MRALFDQKLFLFFLLFPFLGKAQFIRDGEIYGYKDAIHQWGNQSITDNTGARYTIIQFYTDFNLKQTGFPITISRTTAFNNVAIVKFDEQGKYLHHVVVGGCLNRLQVQLMPDNQLLLSTILDTKYNTEVVDSRGNLTRLLDHDTGAFFSNQQSSAILICKINAEGDFLWMNTLKTDTFATNFPLIFPSISGGSNSNCVLDIYNELPTLNYIDSLTLTYTDGSTLRIPARKNMVLHFSDSGSLISYVENPIFKSSKPLSYSRVIQSLSDGNNRYSLLALNLGLKDTIWLPGAFPLEAGKYVILIKQDDHDQIIWHRVIGKGSYLSYDYLMAYDSVLQQLALGVGYENGGFSPNSNAVATSSPGLYTGLTYIAKFNPSGLVTWDRIYGCACSAVGSGFFLESMEFNKKTHNLMMVNSFSGSQLKFENRTIKGYGNQLARLYNYNSVSRDLAITSFFASFDTLNTCTGVEIIKKFDPSGGNYHGYTSNLTNGGTSCTSDSKGKIYITGSLVMDTLWVNCNTHFEDGYSTAPNGSSIIGYTDAFVLIGWPDPVIDTLVCSKMISPSRKYIYDSTGVYTDILKSRINCDSAVIFRVKIGNTKSRFDTTACNSYTSPSGKYHTDSTITLRDTIPNHIGCDSLMIINVHIPHPISSIDTMVCYSMRSMSNKFTWDSSGIYIDTIPNFIGCDSVITIHLKVAHSSASISKAICDSLRSPSGKYTWKTDGIYADTIPNHLGCDSIITFHITKAKSSSHWEYTVCDSLVSTSKRFSWKSNGTYSDTVTSSFGCDSIITIKLEIKKSYSTIDTTYCNYLISPSYKHLYMASGTYMDTIPNTAGCDSVITIRFTRTNLATTVSISSCTSPVSSPSGKYQYTISGTYIDTVPTVQQCDSIVTLHLVIDEFVVKASKSNDISCDTPSALLDITEGTIYNWTPVESLNDPHTKSPIATPKQKTLYHILVTDQFGCKASDSIEVDVNKKDSVNELPNVFTPNGDGINDCLELQSISSASLKTFSCVIFNRWGSLVFESGNTHDCWNGKNKSGQDVTDGVYYFVLKGITTCDTEIVQNGTIQLIR